VTCREQPTREVKRILNAVEAGDLRAADDLLPIVYDELRRLASRKLSREKPGQTLETTALGHEAYIRLVGLGDPGWQNRRHFFGAAAEAMRRILIDRARRKGRIKRGGDRQAVNVEPDELPGGTPAVDLLALGEALAKLEAEDRSKAELVKLHCFAGLTLPEAAAALGVSRATAERHWAYARAWLRVEMGGGDEEAGD